MRQRNGWVLIVCIVVLLLIIFLEPAYGWQLHEWLSPVPPASSSDANNPTLTAQNEALEAQLAKLSSISAEIPTVPGGYIRAMVYSRYPLNFKSEILVDAGSNEGVAVGKAVVFQGIMIGSIIQVFPDSSLVQTVFDSNFKMPVRVGVGGYDALFVGGADPKATSIQKSSPVESGDIVYTAAPGFPYGLPVALVNATDTSADDLFLEASLGFAYDINSIQTVLIAK